MGAKKPDTYTVPEAGKILGLSTKRVRQLIKEGKIKQYGKDPITITQIDVIAHRTARAEKGIAVKGKPTATENIVSLLEALTGQFQKQLEAIAESNRRNEENLLGQIAILERELERKRSRKWWRK